MTWNAFSPVWLEANQPTFLYCGWCQGFHRKDGFSPEQQKAQLEVRYCRGWSSNGMRLNGTNHYPWVEMMDRNLHTYGCISMSAKTNVQLIDIPGAPSK